jgi:cytochrome c biogenesis factor
MIPELGNFALMLAAVVAVMQGVLPIAGTLVRNPQTQVTGSSNSGFAVCVGGVCVWCFGVGIFEQRFFGAVRVSAFQLFAA